MAKKDDPRKPSFITLSQFEDLQKPDRFIPRTLIEHFDEDPGHTEQVDLIVHVQDQLRKLMKSNQNWFGCSCIEIKKGDGMSWDCEAVNQATAREFYHMKRWRLMGTGTLDTLPLITKYVGLKPFLRGAINHELTDSVFSFVTLRPWMAPLIVVVALAISLAFQLQQSFRDIKLNTATASAVFSDPWFYLLNVVLLITGFAAQAATTFLTTRPERDAVEKLVKRLRNIRPKDDRNYDDFIDDLALKLQTIDFPRVVIIDNFELLDATTRHVITRYFKAYASQRSGSEFWIVFENGNGGDRVSNLAFKDSSAAYAKTRLFRQLLLTTQEKKNLVRVAGKSPEAAEYDVVSRICNAEDPQSGETATFFKGYRDRNPKKARGFDDLEFLFLLSLTADNVPLSHRFLVNNLSEKTGPPSDMLRLYLGGSALRMEEFRNALAGIQQKFRDYLIVEPDGERTKIKAVHEKTDVLIDLADELELDAGLGHLFWAFFWHDKQPRPAQAMWLRKLSRHLINAEATSVTDAVSYVSVRMHLFEVMLSCIDKCLKACLFNDIVTLVSKASALLLETEVPHDNEYERKQAQLLRCCWAIYSVLGDEEILRVIVDLYEAPGKVVNYHRESSLLEKIFFESMGLSPEKRKRINAEVLEKIYGRSEADTPVADYVRTRSSWLVLAGGRSVNSDVCKFISALVEIDSSLNEIADSASQRIQAWLKTKQSELEHEKEPAKERTTESKDDINLTDLMSLSLSLWCSALSFNPELWNKRFYTDNPSGENEQEASYMSELAKDISQLFAMAETAALLASEVKRPNGSQSSEFAGGSDYLMSGLAKELCALSLASVLTAQRYLAQSRIELGSPYIKLFNGIIQLNASTLEYTLPQVKSREDFHSRALLMQVDSLMKLCGIIWRRFGTERLADFMNIRRVLFSALCMPNEQDTASTHNSLLQSVGPVMNRNDFAGVVANLTIAEALEPVSGALSANYAIHAADFALNGDFGKPIKDQLVLNAIEAAHNHDYEIESFVKHVTDSIPGQKTLLERFLLSLSEKNISGSVLSWMNLANKISPGEAERVLQILKDFAPSISDEETRTDIEAQLELFYLEREVANGQNINAAELLANWATRRELWVYADVLKLLLDNNYDLEKVKKESLAILHRPAERDNYDSYMRLSLSLARKLKSSSSRNGELEVPMSYLIRSHPRWQVHLGPATNLQVYKELYYWDEENQEIYEEEIVKWSLIELQQDFLKRLPRLINLGHFFLIFRNYFDSLSFYGLETEIGPVEHSNELSIATEERLSEALAWKNSGGAIPQPLISKNSRTVVNSKFLAIGNLIFESPCGEDPEFHQHRIVFDQHARAAIDQLFEAMVNLPRLPPAIRDLLQSYSQMITNETLPTD